MVWLAILVLSTISQENSVLEETVDYVDYNQVYNEEGTLVFTQCSRVDLKRETPTAVSRYGLRSRGLLSHVPPDAVY